MHLDQSVIEKLFFGTWVVIIGGGSLLFFGHFVSPATKQRLYPRYVISVAALFVVFTYLLNGPVGFIVIPVILATFANIKLQRICSRCGTMNWPVFFSPQKFCRKCGASLAPSSAKLNSN